jgi:ribosomal protein S18 acetylase RimI-like enzyme
MNELPIILESPGNAQIDQIILENLIQSNVDTIGPYERKTFSIYIKDNNKIIGGISGLLFVNHDCWVHLVIVDKEFRNNGLGSKMFDKLEEFVRANNCTNIRLETGDFQAKEFYEQHGFKVVATLDKSFLGHTMYIMQQQLRPSE